MQIEDTRHVTLDDYEITAVNVGYDWSTHPPKYVERYISITLEPEGYLRDRFDQGGQSYEKKKHGARRLVIRGRELEKIMGALNDEVTLCHQLLLDHGLIPELKIRRSDANQNREKTGKL